MPNVISAIGYSLGKVHTGMLVYLCDLHREGLVRPLESLFGALGISVPRRPTAFREWNSVDLAIFDGDEDVDGDKDVPRILVEMKVDDHEHKTTKRVDGHKERDFQTIVYPEAFPGCDEYVYITLGVGDHFRAPYGKRFRWIRLRDFAAALDKLDASDAILDNWKEAVRNEADLHKRVRHDDRSRLADYRPGAWNICFLGHLKDAFKEGSTGKMKDLDLTCYTCGRRPDTILNFGCSKLPEYLEINNNGRLNLKVNLEGCADHTAKRCTIAETSQWVRSAYPEVSHEVSESGRVGASKTVVSFDVGLCVSDDVLRFSQGAEHTLRSLREIVDVFQTTPR